MKFVTILLVVILVGVAIWLLVRNRQVSQPASGLPVPEKGMGSTYPHFVFAKIFDPVEPLARGSKYEDPLDEFLQAQHIGEVTGGGTMQNKDGSIEFVGVDIDLADLGDALQIARKKLIELGAPRGSVFEYQQEGKKVVLPFYDN